MTYSIQEVPSWTQYDTGMYDLNLPELLQEDDQCLFSTDGPVEIKIEETYSPVYQPSAPVSSMLASPSLNMPVLCQYNTYSSSPQIVQSMASPSNQYAHSPGGSSTYSASPINSPQQGMDAEEYYRYGLRQAFRARHIQDYGYHYPSEFATAGGKRRKRDDELTSEEYEKRRLRRERNKQAALRCRTRRRERIDALEQETTQIEEDNHRVETEIKKLKDQINELQELLQEHKCDKQINLNDLSQSKSSQITTKK